MFEKLYIVWEKADVEILAMARLMNTHHSNGLAWSIHDSKRPETEHKIFKTALVALLFFSEWCMVWFCFYFMSWGYYAGLYACVICGNEPVCLYSVYVLYICVCVCMHMGLHVHSLRIAKKTNNNNKKAKWPTDNFSPSNLFIAIMSALTIKHMQINHHGLRENNHSYTHSLNPMIRFWTHM